MHNLKNSIIFLIIFLSCGPTLVKDSTYNTPSYFETQTYDDNLLKADSEVGLCYFLCPKISFSFELASCSSQDHSLLTCVYEGVPDRYWCSCPTNNDIGQGFLLNNKLCSNIKRESSFICNYNKSQDLIHEKTQTNNDRNHLPISEKPLKRFNALDTANLGNLIDHSLINIYFQKHTL